MQSFVVWSDGIEGRLDVFYYLPEFIELERKIKKHSSKTLGDFIINISSGATPEKDESEKYYTDSAENGVPFLRVQNVTENGLSLEDCKFINFDTHNGMLKRSQVKEGYLLTKITGVGRMAVSSVAPNGFEGNINQHLVAIKTDSYQTSEVLSAFLNSDIGERLAFRRSTGGTRPALDYQALKAIPVFFNPEIVDIMQSAYDQKKHMEAEAQRLLDSIDGYILDELSIKLPEVEDKMCFAVSSEEVQSNRADAYYYQPKFEKVENALRKGKYDLINFANMITDLKNGVEIRKYADGGYRYLRVTDLGKFGIIDNAPRLVAIDEIPERIKLHDNSFLISRSGSLGLVSVVEEKIKDAILSSHIFKVDLDTDKILPKYLEAFFRSTLGQIQFFRNNNGGIVPEISQSALKSLLVVVPSLEIQNKIAAEVRRRISEAERLKAAASKIIEEAKKKVEEMILWG